MIQINGIWESIQDVDDLLRITTENISYEFACEVRRIWNEQSENIKDEIHELQSEIDELETIINDYDDIQEQLNYIYGQLNELRDYIDANDNSSDFIKGMKKALEIIDG